jgi:hypothetical protein
MKTLLSIIALAAPLQALTVSATFDSIPTSLVQSGYLSGGLTFTSPTPFYVVSGLEAGTLFGWTGASYTDGKALAVNNVGWVGISAGGSGIDSLSFTYGFDWSAFAIECGLMDVNVEWRALVGGQVVETGGKFFTRENRSHGGATLVANPLELADEIQIRSTAILYQGAPWVGPNPYGFPVDRGVVVGGGTQNKIAFDNVAAVLAQAAPAAQLLAVGVPETGNAGILFACVIGLLLVCRHIQRIAQRLG